MANGNNWNPKTRMYEAIEDDRKFKDNVVLGNVSKSVICENYNNGFYADYGTDLCENCGERKGKHN